MAMYVESELFVIPNDKSFILYAPLKQIAVAVSGGVVRDLQTCEISGLYPQGRVRDVLLKLGILSDIPIEINKSKDSSDEEFLPTKVTLFPTSDCGLRCVYCYASAGELPKVMEFPVAKAAIDFVIKNALAVKNNSVSVSFHGGGEPLFGKSGLLVKKIVRYAKDAASKQKLGISFSCATNGVLSENQLNWIADNLHRLNISLDGPPDIQDVQRPLKSGAGSSRFVERTLAFVNKHKMSHGIRATITRLSVGRLSEIVEYLHRSAPFASLHIEPLFACGRCATTGAEAPDRIEFVEAFIKAKQYAGSLGVDIYNSGGSIEKCDEYFCSAARGMFCVTPWGDVTSCYEVSLPSDSRAPIFFFGAYNTNSHSFSFDTAKLKRLRGRRVSNIPKCKDCFLKYACSGDCLAKSVLMSGSLDGGFRCYENKILAIEDLVGRMLPIAESTI